MQLLHSHRTSLDVFAAFAEPAIRILCLPPSLGRGSRICTYSDLMVISNLVKIAQFELPRWIMADTVFAPLLQKAHLCTEHLNDFAGGNPGEAARCQIIPSMSNCEQTAMAW